MSNKHTSGALRWLTNHVAYGPLKGAYIDDVAGTARVADVLSHGGVGQERCEANARRLVACWNACVGIPTEVLDNPPEFAIEGLLHQIRGLLNTLDNISNMVDVCDATGAARAAVDAYKKEAK